MDGFQRSEVLSGRQQTRVVNNLGENQPGTRERVASGGEGYIQGGPKGRLIPDSAQTTCHMRYQANRAQTMRSQAAIALITGTVQKASMVSPMKPSNKVRKMRARVV